MVSKGQTGLVESYVMQNNGSENGGALTAVLDTLPYAALSYAEHDERRVWISDGLCDWSW